LAADAVDIKAGLLWVTHIQPGGPARRWRDWSVLRPFWRNLALNDLPFGMICRSARYS
jgi:hypothetical protein